MKESSGERTKTGSDERGAAFAIARFAPGMIRLAIEECRESCRNLWSKTLGYEEWLVLRSFIGRRGVTTKGGIAHVLYPVRGGKDYLLNSRRNFIKTPSTDFVGGLLMNAIVLLF